MLHTCTSRAHDKKGRSAAQRFGVRAWSPVVRTRTNMRVTRTWYTRATRVVHACYTHGTRVRLLSCRWAVLYQRISIFFRDLLTLTLYIIHFFQGQYAHGIHCILELINNSLGYFNGNVAVYKDLNLVTVTIKRYFSREHSERR